MLNIWTAPFFSLQPQPGMGSFIQWFRFLRNRLAKETFTVAVVVCWRLWWQRNQFGVGMDGGENTIEWASHFLEAYRSSQFPGSVVKTAPMNALWKAPPASSIKINVDVGFMDTTSYQVAAVARKNDGSCVGWKVRKMAGQPPAVVGEARAALEGVTLALAHGWVDVIFEGDCSQVISAIQNRLSDPLLSYGAIISQLLLLSSSFRQFSSSFVRRSRNSLAHALAHLSLEHADVSEDSMLHADLALII